MRDAAACATGCCRVPDQLLEADAAAAAAAAAGHAVLAAGRVVLAAEHAVLAAGRAEHAAAALPASPLHWKAQWP